MKDMTNEQILDSYEIACGQSALATNFHEPRKEKKYERLVEKYRNEILKRLSTKKTASGPSFTNLFIGYNKQENFRILICAFDEEEAKRLSEEYLVDSKMDGTFDISESTENSINVHFDCDYIIK